MLLDPRDVGQAIARLRGRRSQAQVARQGALPAAQWSIYESGRRLPNRDSLAKILRGLGCTEQDLLDETLKMRARRLRGQDKGATGAVAPGEGQGSERDVRLLVTELRSLQAHLMLLSTYFVGLDRRIAVLAEQLGPDLGS